MSRQEIDTVIYLILELDRLRESGELTEEIETAMKYEIIELISNSALSSTG